MGIYVGYTAVLALLIAAIFMAVLDRREKAKGNTTQSKFLSRLALGLFLVAFVGGVVVTLVGGIRPRENSMGMIRGRAGSPPDSSEGSGFAGPERIGPIGTIDEKELAALQKKVASNPKDFKSRERLGHLYLQMQDFENVFKMAHEALQLNPKGVESRVHMAMVLFAMGERDQAIAQFDQALAIDPKNEEALRFRNMVEMMGDR